MKSRIPASPALATGLIALALLAAPALGQRGSQEAPASTGVAAAADGELTEAEVRRVDPAMGTILLKHGEIRNLGMGAMTMGFRLRDPRLADGLKAGDKVRFSAVQDGDALVVTRLVRQR